jgi:DNA polymerase-4
VLYVNITRFPIAVERVLSPELYSRPVVIAPPHSGRSPLWESSDEAREWGIVPGMPLVQAKKLCSGLKVLPPRPELYSRVARELEEKVVAKTTPLYEVEAPGHFFLDMTGFEKIYPHLPDKALDLQKDILSSFNLKGSLGGASNKLVSKVAAQSSEMKRGIRFVESGDEGTFFSPLSVSVLPPIQEMMRHCPRGKNSICEELNIKINKDIVSLGPFYLQVAFSEKAFEILEMAKGIDLSPIMKSSKKDGHYEGTYLKEESNDLIKIQKVLLNLVSRGTHFLRERGTFPGCLHLFLRYSDYKFVHKKCFLRALTLDLEVLSESFLKLLQQAFKRRTSIHYLAVEFGDLVQEELQLNLFTEKTEKKKEELMDVMGNIRRKFGENSLFLGREE